MLGLFLLSYSLLALLFMNGRNLVVLFLQNFILLFLLLELFIFLSNLSSQFLFMHNTLHVLSISIRKELCYGRKDLLTINFFRWCFFNHFSRPLLSVLFFKALLLSDSFLFCELRNNRCFFFFWLFALFHFRLTWFKSFVVLTNLFSRSLLVNNSLHVPLVSIRQELRYWRKDFFTIDLLWWKLLYDFLCSLLPKLLL